MKSHLLVLVAGLLAGVALMMVTDPLTDRPANTAVSTEEPEKLQDYPTRSDTLLEQTTDVASPRAKSSTSDADVIQLRPVDHSDIRLPSLYKEMIGPVRPRRPTFSERHENFA